MRKGAIRFALAVAAMVGGGAGPAAADAAPGALLLPATGETDLGREMTVQNWILCTQQSFAEEIAAARALGEGPARKVYGDLATAKSCGMFATMTVILREPVYASAPDVDHQTRIYRASVSIGGDWPTAFVIYGGL
jgi:hypothetical protein